MKCDNDWICVIIKSIVYHKLYTETNKKVMLENVSFAPTQSKICKTLVEVEVMINLYKSTYRKHVILKECNSRDSQDTV